MLLTHELQQMQPDLERSLRHIEPVARHATAIFAHEVFTCVLRIGGI